MYRIRDFVYREVMDLNGKNLGFVGDLSLDFNLKMVRGFDVISNSILKKNININMEDILGFEPEIIAVRSHKDSMVKFNDVRSMDVVDKRGNIMGRLDDVIFYEKDFRIRAFVLSCGFISDILYGKKIFPCRNFILGEKNIFYKKI